jgi:ribosomal protein L40E
MTRAIESDPDLECGNPDCRARNLIFRNSKGPALIRPIHEGCGGTFKATGNIGRFSDYECNKCGAGMSFTIRTYQCRKCKEFTDVDLREVRSKDGETTIDKRATGEFRIDRLQ